MAADQQGFLSLLSSLLSTDDAVRRNAENQYELIPVECKAIHLVGAICDVTTTYEGRTHAAIFLTELTRHEAFHDLPRSIKCDLFDKQLLCCLNYEADPTMARRICKIVASFFLNLFPEVNEGDSPVSCWPSIFTLIFHPCMKQIPLKALKGLCIMVHAPGVFKNSDFVRDFFAKCVLDLDFTVRVEAAKMLAEFFLFHRDDEGMILRVLYPSLTRRLSFDFYVPDVSNRCHDFPPTDIPALVVNVLVESIGTPDCYDVMECIASLARNVPAFPIGFFIKEALIRVCSQIRKPDLLRSMFPTLFGSPGLLAALSDLANVMSRTLLGEPEPQPEFDLVDF